MEELAIKPLEPIPKEVNYSMLEQNSIIRSVLTYNYGEDVAKWAAILPFTLNANHTQSAGSILSLFDSDLTSYYEISQVNKADGSYTSTIIFDFGKLLEIRGIILGGNLNLSAPAALHDATLEYTLDGINYITITTKSGNSTGDNFFDIVSNINRVRGLKLIYKTGGGAGVTYKGRFYQLMVIV